MNQLRLEVKKKDFSEVLDFIGGEDEDRTHDLCIANAALSQLSYPPTRLQSSNKSAAPQK